jgi:hypothetical protein
MRFTDWLWGNSGNRRLKICHYRPTNSLVQIQHTKNSKITDPYEASKTKFQRESASLQTFTRQDWYLNTMNIKSQAAASINYTHQTNHPNKHKSQF